MTVTGDAAASDCQRQARAVTPKEDTRAWMSAYIRRTAITDCACALAAGVLAAELRFAIEGHVPRAYLLLTCALPALWWASVLLAGGYDTRLIGLGSDEFRRVLNAAVGLAAGIAIVAYATNLPLARGYLVIALPVATGLDITARHRLRKRLHRMRSGGSCTRRVVAVGHTASVANLVTALRRDTHHGLAVVAACVADPCGSAVVTGVPVAGELHSVAEAVTEFGADTVAVLACPEMDGTRLRELAWQLEKTGTDLCVAPALLDVAGPRTTIRPVAGLPLLHVDHPELAGTKRLVKSCFDKLSAAFALGLLAMPFAAIALLIKITDPGPVIYRQTRVGKDGRPFTLYKFRTMVVGADKWKELLTERNEADGVLFKIRRDPRVTAVGGWLRRWSVDELPQLLNVLRGDMSMVGPRPALPEEAACYGHLVRRRLVVKPGITGLWQVSGRSELSWDEAVRLDLRYVENWSLALDLQILWKTASAVVGGLGAY
jgi:exopolysaccharide biosynthesis polyprenyl glycosylphosphotransferase